VVGSTDRDELLEREDEAWSALVAVVAAVPADRRETEGVVPGWSTRDLVWHCAAWAGYADDVLERIRRGEPAPEPLVDEDARNAEILAASRGTIWDDAVLRLAQNRRRARQAFAAFDDPPVAAIERFRCDTFEHYEEHAAQIRAFMDDGAPS